MKRNGVGRIAAAALVFTLPAGATAARSSSNFTATPKGPPTAGKMTAKAEDGVLTFKWLIKR